MHLRSGGLGPSVWQRKQRKQLTHRSFSGLEAGFLVLPSGFFFLVPSLLSLDACPESRGRVEGVLVTLAD